MYNITLTIAISHKWSKLRMFKDKGTHRTQLHPLPDFAEQVAAAVLGRRLGHLLHALLFKQFAYTS